MPSKITRGSAMSVRDWRKHRGILRSNTEGHDPKLEAGERAGSE
jgi:hypothetical protein